MSRADRVAGLIPEMIAWRHELHAAPELGFEEVRTAARVAQLCRQFGLQVTEGIAGTGVVATLQGRRGSGRAIAFRAELDALPIAGTRDLPHASRKPGIMHACGHDGHMAMLLGAAKILAANPDFSGMLHFIFQPAEEGQGGAKAMLADGLFERFPADEIYALHNCDAPLGKVMVHHGVVAAAADQFEITLSGQGGHAAEPHRARNPLPAAARLLLALESLPARQNDARHPCVVTVGALNAGEAFNTIPEQARLSGTVRALDMEARTQIEEAVHRQARGQAAAEGLEVEIRYSSPFHVTRNSHAEAEHVIRAARGLFGENALSIDPPPEMGSEDFSFLLEQRPGCYFLLGQGDDGHRALCHDPAYDFNDRALEPGVRLWVRLAEERLACN